MDALRATSILSDEKPLFCGLVTKLSAVHECNGGCTVLSQRKAEAAVKYEESSADYLRSQILLFYLRKICRNGQEETFCNYLSLCDVAKQDRIGLGISPANVSDIQSGLLKRILASSSYRISGKVAVCLEHLERHLPVATDAGRKELAVMQENLDSTQLIQAGLQRASSDRLLLTVQLHKRLSDYISQMSTLIDRHLKPETKLCDASVASMEERTKSLLLKLKVEQLEVTKATYTARNMEALRKVRGLLAERTEQLSKDLEQRKLKAKQYEVVAGPDYQKLLAEHLKILEEIESCKWGLSNFNHQT